MRAVHSTSRPMGTRRLALLLGAIAYSPADAGRDAAADDRRRRLDRLGGGAAACGGAGGGGGERAAVPSAAAAVAELLAAHPRVVAFGEYHQTAATAHIPSALRRFIDELWPVVAPGAAGLIVETWISQGNCGEEEKTVVAGVAKTTERPVETESEVVTLIRRAKEAKVPPQILQLSCADYASIHPKGEIDYERMLRLTSDKLQGRIEAALAAPAGPRRTVVVYGGALHNDLLPVPELAPFTFGSAVRARVGQGQYLEVDLYVPEYVERDRRIQREPWFRAYQRLARRGQPALVERAPDSFIVVLPRSRSHAPKARRTPSR